MTTSPPPGITGVVDGLLAELRDVNGWIAEVRKDLRTSEQRRVMLANALDSALSTLDRPIQDHYSHEIGEILGDIGPRSTGRPVTDERQEVVLQYLAEWPEAIITTAELRIMLERKRLPGGKNYVSNLLKSFVKRGFVMRVGHGRYRVTRLHPTLFARRHGIDKQISRYIREGEEEARVRRL